MTATIWLWEQAVWVCGDGVGRGILLRTGARGATGGDSVKDPPSLTITLTGQDTSSCLRSEGGLGSEMHGKDKTVSLNGDPNEADFAGTGGSGKH